MKLRTPLLAVDAVIFNEEGKICLIKRKNPPFEAHWALPGGFVEIGETCEEAVHREVKEETALLIALKGLVGVYSKPDRDPRGHVVSIVYLARSSGEAKGGDDAQDAHWFSFPLQVPLAFDHKIIIEDALRHPACPMKKL